MEDNEKNQLHQINLAFDLITLSFKRILIKHIFLILNSRVSDSLIGLSIKLGVNKSVRRINKSVRGGAQMTGGNIEL